MSDPSHVRTEASDANHINAETRPLKLSICITTFNRARFLGATLESILSQLDRNCEIVLLDGASTDNTEQVVAEYTHRTNQLRYIRQHSNQGIDRDYDRTVQLARGEYCWFMTDDDLLKQGAIARVMDALNTEVSMILVNYQRFDIHMSEVLVDRFLDIHADVVYDTADMDKLLSEAGVLLMYIGSLIIKRSIWMDRNRARYFDTMLMHMAVIFQKKLPGQTLLIAEPLISYRDGNPRTFWPKMFEIFLIKFPENVSSFDLNDQERSRYLFGDPRKSSTLLLYRAMGWYSILEYRKWLVPRLPTVQQRLIPFLVAVSPGILVNSVYILVKSWKHTRFRKGLIQHLRMSPFYFRNYLRQRLS